MPKILSICSWIIIKKKHVLSYNKYVLQISSTQIRLDKFVECDAISYPLGNINLQCGNPNYVNTTYRIFTYS